MKIPDHGICFPEKGDIWCDDDGYFYLFLGEPSWTEDTVNIKTLVLTTGEIKTTYYPVDPKTGTLCDWYWKVA